MKKNKIILIFILCTFCFSASTALARKEIPFPDYTTLQPIPDTGAPNISGNIDWPKGPGDQDQNTDVNTNNPNTTTGQNTVGDNSTNNTNTPSGTASSNQNGNDTNMQDSASAGNGGTQNNGGPSTNSNGSAENSGTQNNNSGPSVGSQNSPASYNFDTIPPTGNEQTQGAPAGNSGTSDNSAAKQDAAQPQQGISQSSYVWALIFGSMILFVAAFVAWRLKRTPDDVN